MPLIIEFITLKYSFKCMFDLWTRPYRPYESMELSEENMILAVDMMDCYLLLPFKSVVWIFFKNIFLRLC